MDSDYGIPRELSDLQKLRSTYQPLLPPCLQGTTVRVEFGDATTAADPSGAHTISRIFPHTYGQPLAHFLRETAKVPDAKLITDHPAIRVGVVFCGRQSPGGHNVIWGLLNALKIHNPNSTLLGFLGGSEGLFAQKTLEVTDDILTTYKNQGGYDLLGRTQDQIRTIEQVNAALAACTALKLDGLVIIGGVTSNTDAAQLAETFAVAKCPTKKTPKDKKASLVIHGLVDKCKAKKVTQAQNLWFEILKSQIETGTPYMLFKDTCNRKSNQQNLGTIKSSNLCTEIIEYTSPTETAVCNLASIALPRYVAEKGVPIESHPSKLIGSKGSKNQYFDFDKLAEVAAIVTSNLNKIIDVNYYPVETTKRSNLRHRPIGIGVQGLADTFILLGMAFDSPEAQQLNKDIFETIYYHALKASSELATKEGPYETYSGSPVSKGILQPDMWGVTPSSRWDWGALRDMIANNGVRNSLLGAPMPTASTSQILGNNECFEPGEFVVVNKHLLYDLTEMGLWSPALKNQIIYEDGSVQKIPEIPDELKVIYKTVWEIKQKTLVDMAVDRELFVDVG